MFRTICQIIAILSLGVLIGAITMFGFGVAPVLFQPGLLPGRTIAGAVNSAILHRLLVLSGIAVTLGFGTVLYGAVSRHGRRDARSWVSFSMIVVCLVLVYYTGLILFPEINALRLEIGSFDAVLSSKQEAHAAFEKLHTLFSTLVRIELFAALIALILLVWKMSGLRLPVRHQAEHPTVSTKQRRESARANVPASSGNSKDVKIERLPAVKRETGNSEADVQTQKEEKNIPLKNG